MNKCILAWIAVSVGLAGCVSSDGRLGSYPFGITLGEAFRPVQAQGYKADDWDRRLMLEDCGRFGHDVNHDRVFSSRITDTKLVEVALAKPFFGQILTQVLTDATGVGYEFSLNGSFRSGMTRRESLDRIQSVLKQAEHACGFRLNPYRFFRGGFPDLKSLSELPEGGGSELWLNLNEVTARSLTKHGSFQVFVICSLQRNREVLELASMRNAATADGVRSAYFKIVVSIPALKDAEQLRLEKMRNAWREKKRVSEKADLAEFYGIRFDQPIATNGLFASCLRSWSTDAQGKQSDVKERNIWIWKRMDLKPAEFFDSCSITCSYDPAIPEDAYFYGHFPKGMSRKECLKRLDEFVLQTNARYGVLLSCGGKYNRLEEDEPDDFVPGEIHEQRRHSDSRDHLRDFVRYRFSNYFVSIHITAHETIFGERTVVMSITKSRAMR